MRKHHGQDGSLFVQDKTMFYLESYTSPSPFGPHAPEFPLSLSLSSAYKVGANNLWTGESFGYEKRAAKWLEVFRAPDLRGGAVLLRLPPREITDLTNENHT